MGNSIWEYIAAGVVKGAEKGLFGDPEEDERQRKQQQEMYSSYKTFREMGMGKEESEVAINSIYGGKKSGLLNKAFSANKKIFTAPNDQPKQQEVWDYDKAGNLVKVGNIPDKAKLVSRGASRDPNQWTNQDMLRRRDQLKKDMEEWAEDDPRTVTAKQKISYIDSILDKGFGTPAPDDSSKDPTFQNNAALSPGMRVQPVSPVQPVGMTTPGFGKATTALAQEEYVTLKSPSGTVAKVPKSRADYFIKKGAKQIA